MTILIEGVAFPIGILNANGEGVPYTEIDNAINSLKTSVVRICSRISPHICDSMGDPLSEIGHVVDAWQDGNNIIVKAVITDSVAARKIKEKTWGNTWSVYGGYDTIDSGGWVHGVLFESITLVDNPAWDSATWKIVSASAGGKNEIRSVSPFTVVKTPDLSASKNKGSGKIPDENTIEELESKLAEANKLIEDLKPKAEAAEALETQVEELTASKTDLEKQIDEFKKMKAAYEKDKAVAVPLDKVQELIASAIAEHDEKQKASNEREAAFSAFAAARKTLGLETDPEDFKSLSASDLAKLAEDLGGVKFAASGVNYPSSNTPAGMTVGRYDPVKKEWVI